MPAKLADSYYDEVLARIYGLRGVYVLEWGKRPNTVYLGRREWYGLLDGNRDIFGIDLTSDKARVFGMDIVRTIYDTHLSLGFVLVEEEFNGYKEI